MLHRMMCPCPVNNVATYFPPHTPAHLASSLHHRPATSGHCNTIIILPRPVTGVLLNPSATLLLRPLQSQSPTLSLTTSHISQLNSSEADRVEGSSSAVAPCLLSEVCSPGRTRSILVWKHKPSRQCCRFSRSSASSLSFLHAASVHPSCTLHLLHAKHCGLISSNTTQCMTLPTTDHADS
jgi:hypothetical protein